MPFGQYDSSDNSIDALGLNVNESMYDAVNGKESTSRGRCGRNIIICLIVTALAVIMLVMTAGKLLLERKIVKQGSVTEAVYDSQTDAYLAMIPVNHEMQMQQSWQNTWQYQKDGTVMKVYTFADGDAVYATPAISFGVWAVMFAVPIVIIAVCAFLLFRNVRAMRNSKS